MVPGSRCKLRDSRQLLRASLRRDPCQVLQRERQALNPATAGTVQNVGLMAQKAEEYGSHPTTFEVPTAGTVKMILEDGTVLHEHARSRLAGYLAVRLRASGPDRGLGEPCDLSPKGGRLCRAIFWLDAEPRA